MTQRDLFSQPIETHIRENNIFSQQNLDANRAKFSNDCKKVLAKLMAGERLTRREAVITGLSNSLERRVADLKEYGIVVCTEWADANKTHVEYYMERSEIARVFRLLDDVSYEWVRVKKEKVKA